MLSSLIVENVYMQGLIFLLEVFQDSGLHGPLLN